MTGKWVRWVALAAGASPALVPLWIILTYGVDVPYWDQWDNSLAGLYIKAADGQLKLTDFTAQHNEHRIIVPRTLAFVLNRMTGWNTVGEMLLQWVVVCLTSGCILWLARQTIGGGKLDGRVILLWFLSNVMVFTPAQHENWLWGMGLMNVMPPLFLAGAMAVVYSGLRQEIRLGLAILFSAAAMFSLGSGVFVFPLMAILWAWSDSWKQFKAKRTTLAIWAGGFALFLVMFIYGYSRPPVAAGLEYKVVSMGDRVNYLLTFMGTQFIAVQAMERPTAAMIAGTILLTLMLAALGYFLFLWLVRRAMQTVAPMLPWCLMGLFVLLSAFMAMVFRTIVGQENAMSSRYVTFTLYVPVALIFLVPMTFQDLQTRFPAIRLGGAALLLRGVWSHTPTVLATALVTVHLLTMPSVMRGCELSLYGRLKTKATLHLINIVPENPKLGRGVYPDVKHLRRVAERLDELGYIRPRLLKNPDANLIRDTSYDLEGDKDFGVFERIGESSPNVITAGGWAMWRDGMKPADLIVLTYRNDRGQEIIFAASEGVVPRGDLVTARNHARDELAGWLISFAVASFPADFTSVRITAWALDAETGKVRPLMGHMTLARGPQTAP